MNNIHAFGHKMSADTENPTGFAVPFQKGRVWLFKKKHLGVASIILAVVFAICIFLGVHYYRRGQNDRISQALSSFTSKKDKESAEVLYSAIMDEGAEALTTETVEELIRVGIYDHLSEEKKSALKSIFSQFVKDDPLPRAEAELKEAWNNLLNFIDKKSKEFLFEALYSAIMDGGALTTETVEELISVGIYDHLSGEKKSALKSIFFQFVKVDPLPVAEADLKKACDNLLNLIVDEESKKFLFLLECSDNIKKISDLEDSKAIVESIKQIFDAFYIATEGLDSETKEKKMFIDFISLCTKFGEKYNFVYKIKSNREDVGGPNYDKFSLLSRVDMMPFMKMKDLSKSFESSLEKAKIDSALPGEEPDTFVTVVNSKLNKAYNDKSDNDTLSTLLELIYARINYLELTKNFLEATKADASVISSVDKKLGVKFVPNLTLSGLEDQIKEEIEGVKDLIDALNDPEASILLEQIGRNFHFKTMVEFFKHIIEIEEKKIAAADLEKLMQDLEKLVLACSTYLRSKYCLNYYKGFSLIESIDHLLGPVNSLKRQKTNERLKYQIGVFVKRLADAHNANTLRGILNDTVIDSLKDLKENNADIFLENIFNLNVLKTIFYHLLALKIRVNSEGGKSDIGDRVAEDLVQFKDTFNGLRDYATFLGTISNSLIGDLGKPFKTLLERFSYFLPDESDEEAKNRFQIVEELSREIVAAENKRKDLFECSDTLMLLQNALLYHPTKLGSISISNLFFIEYVFFFNPDDLYGATDNFVSSHQKIQNSFRTNLINDKIINLLSNLKEKPISSLLWSTKEEKSMLLLILK